MLPGLENISLMYRLRSGTRSGEAETILLTNQLYFASPLAMNDSDEARPKLIFSNHGRIAPRLIREFVDRDSPKLSYTKRRELAANAIRRRNDSAEARANGRKYQEASFRALTQNSSLCCFFRDDMDIHWAHYGNEHRGYALAFERRCDFPFTGPDARDRIGEVDEPFKGFALPVKYRASNEYPVIDMDVDVYDPRKMVRVIVDSQLSKSEQWKHENELRSIRPGVLPSLQEFNPKCLRAVIFCRKAPKALMLELASLLKRRSIAIPLFLREKVEGSYEHTYKQIL